MIVVELMGGMGNQMFQYAFGRHLAHRLGADLVLDKHFLLDRTPKKNEHFVFRNYDLDLFNIEASFLSSEISKKYNSLQNRLSKKISRWVPRIKGLKVIEQQGFAFESDLLELNDNCYLKGYWQTEKYFKDIEDIIKKDFTFKEPISVKSQSILTRIQSTEAVCLNVRRGDFVTNPVHGILDVSYYQKTEQIFLKKANNPTFFVFSDDIDWCRENIKLQSPTVFVGHEYAGSKFKDYLGLMINCKHFIIPNSSFAWWAAWLCYNPNKIVIAPHKWFNESEWDSSDVIPEHWIQY